MGLLTPTDQFIADNWVVILIVLLISTLGWCAFVSMLLDVVGFCIRRYNYARMYSATRWSALKIALRRS